MQDPSQGIQRELLPHVHLVSTYRFPQLPAVHPDKVAEWLLGAPKISRDQAPFYWTYLDRPADGTILLVWQSMSLGLDFPSDGYIWPPQETAFSVEVSGGYTLEMYQQKTGYVPPENLATHSRRRYRLLPSKFPNSAGPAPDLSLWIVHYTQADPQDRVPANVIPIDMRIQQMMNTRAYLHSHGQILQKEFMLHDRSNWPQIAFPRGNPRGAPMYGQNTPQARVPQTMAYPTQHPTTGPPTKRARTTANPSQAAPGSAVAVLDVDDEEDTSRGDLFDHTTPREISMSRYKQNHEWMEEILSSPYSINQIIPADLGLGIRGELAGLTSGIFDAPLDPDKDVPKYNYVGRLDAEKADEFRKRVDERIAQNNKDMEKMKAKHAKRLARFQKGSQLATVEKELRTAVDNPSDTGPEYWRLEGKIDEDDSPEDRTTSPDSTVAKVSDIVAKVEASVGRHIAQVKELIRIQDGGYEEAPAVPSPPPQPEVTRAVSPQGSNHGSNHSGVLVTDADLELGNSAAGLLDQYHTGLSSNATPGSSFPTPQPLLHATSSAGTPNVHVPSPQPSGAAQDVHMSDAGEVPAPTVADSTASTSGDWVVVPPGGVSPPASAAAAGAPSTTQDQSHTSSQQPPADPPNTQVQTEGQAQPSPLPTNTAQTSTTNTPGAPLDFHTSPNDFADLQDLDSAGDALASYQPDEEDGDGHIHGDDGHDHGLGDLGDIDGMEGMHDLGDLGGVDHDEDGLGGEMEMEDLGMMDDSAFGDAFHGVDVDHEGGLGDTPAAD